MHAVKSCLINKTLLLCYAKMLAHNLCWEMLTWAVTIAIFRICMASFHGFLPRAQNFSQGFIKKNLSFRLIWSSKRRSSLGDELWWKAQGLSSWWELQLFPATSGFAISREGTKHFHSVGRGRGPHQRIAVSEAEKKDWKAGDMRKEWRGLLAQSLVQASHQLRIKYSSTINICLRPPYISKATPAVF